MPKSERTFALSQRLQELIKEKKGKNITLSQTQQAKQMNIPHQNFAKYVNNEAECSISTICKIATYYGVTTDYLLGLTDINTIPDWKKEKEPAPSEDNTGYENQKNYIFNNNDNTEKEKCQDLRLLIGNLKMIYDDLPKSKRQYWLLGKMFAELGRLIKEDGYAEN